MTLTRTVSDEDLARRAAAGDRDAAGDLVARHYPALFGLARRMTPSDDAARDAVQETFFRALRHISSYSHENRFAAWLFRILTNHLRDAAKRRRPEYTEPDEYSGDAAGPLDAVLEREDLHRAKEAIDRLPESLKLAVLLYYGQGLAAREVAVVLGISHDAARLKLSRAVRRLREEVGR